MISKEEQIKIYNKFKDKYKGCEFILQDNNDVNFILYRASSISTILNINSIRSIIRDYDETEKIYIKNDTNGGKQNVTYITCKGLLKLHRLKRKMRQNTVMTCIFYNYVSNSLLNVLLRFSYLLYL